MPNSPASTTTQPITTSANPNASTDKKHTSPRNSTDDEKHHNVNKSDLPLSETDPKAAKQKAAEDKLQLLGTMQAMKQGRMPHNAQLDELLNKLITNKVISSREHLMSPDGKLLLNDFRKLLKTVEKALAVKNKDELFQSLVYHLHCMESPITKDQFNESMKVNTDNKAMKEEGKKGSDALFKIGKLILLDNEFRALLGELINISQDIFNSITSKVGDSLAQASSGLKNDENQPNKNGKQFVDKFLDKTLDPNRKTVGTTDNTVGEEPHCKSYHDQEPRPVSSPNDDPRHQSLLNTGDSVHPNAIPGGFPIATSLDRQEQGAIGQQPLGGQQTLHQQQGALGQQPLHNQQQAGEFGQQPFEHQQGATLGQNNAGVLGQQPLHQQQGVLGHQQQSFDESNVAGNATNVDPLLQQQQQQQRGDAPFDQGIDSQTAHNFGGTNNNYQQKIENHSIYQNAKAEMYEHKAHVHNIFKENLPKEKQDELLHRLQAALAHVQKHPDYQDAIDTLIQLIKIWSTRLSQVTEGVKTNVKEGDHPEQVNYREQAERELKAIIECWAQGQSIDPLLHGVQEVMRDMQNDGHLRDFYHNVMQYVDRLVRDPGYASQDKAVDEGKRLMDRGNQLIKGRYSEHLNYLSTESRKLINLMAEDEISKELNHRVATIHRDLWMDSEGNPAFKPHLLNDMTKTLLPAFIDEIKYVPIPRIKYSDSQYDIVIENLIVSGDTLLPNVFNTKIESFNSFSLRTDTESKPSRQSLYVHMSEIQAELDNVVFFYNKKTGFPKLSDHGVASLSVGGKGISISLRIHSVVDNPAKTFKVAFCKVNVDNLKVKVNDSNHDILYKAIRPLLTGITRKQVAKALEVKITELLNQGDQKLTKSIVDMNRSLQTKAYEALPEHEKAGAKPPAVSQTRSRPGFFSTLVTIINRNIKTKVQQRNEAKRMERMSMSQDGNSSIYSKTQVEGGHNRKDLHIGTQHHHQPGFTGASPDRHIGTEQPYQPSYASFNDAFMETGRHNFIASPPLSPKKHDHSNNFKSATNLSDAQQHHIEQQLKQTQI